MDYTDLNDALRRNNPPAFLRSAIVVLDIDFGRVPPQLLVCANRLCNAWYQLKVRKEPFSCAAIVVSPAKATLWRPEIVSRPFGRELVCLALPEPRV